MLLLMLLYMLVLLMLFLYVAANASLYVVVIDAYTSQMYRKNAPWVQTDHGEVISLCPPCTSPCTRTWTEEARQNTSLQPRHTRTCDS